MVDFSALKEQLVQQGIDFDRLADGMGLPIDEPIKPLLYVLNLKGYPTTASCGGHPLEEHRARIQRGIWAPYGTIRDETPFGFIVDFDFSTKPAPYRGPKRVWQIYDEAPWVEINIPDEKVQRLDELVASYNAENAVLWKRLPSEQRHRLQPEPKYSLLAMQEDVKRFAEYFWNNV